MENMNNIYYDYVKCGQSDDIVLNKKENNDNILECKAASTSDPLPEPKIKTLWLGPKHMT